MSGISVMFFGWYTSATAKAMWMEKKKVYGIYVDVRCCTIYCKGRDCMSGKISSYCFEIFEMGWE